MPSLESSGTLLPGVGPGEGGGWSDGAGIIEQNGNHAGEAGGKQGPGGILGNLSKALDLSSPSGQAIFTTAMGLMSGEGKNFLDVAGRAGQGGLGVFSQAKSSQELSELRKEQQKANRADEMWRRQVQAAEFRMRHKESGQQSEQWERQFERQGERYDEEDRRWEVEQDYRDWRDTVNDKWKGDIFDREGEKIDYDRWRDLVGDEKWVQVFDREGNRIDYLKGRDKVLDDDRAQQRAIQRQELRQARLRDRSARERERVQEGRLGRQEGRQVAEHERNISRFDRLEGQEQQITPADRNAEKKRLERMIPLIKDPTQKNDAELFYSDIVSKTPMTRGELQKRRALVSARSVQRVQPGVSGESHRALIEGGGAPPSSIPSHARGTAPAGSQAPNVTGDDLKARREARSAQ
jgi:hypothetical protein